MQGAKPVFGGVHVLGNPLYQYCTISLSLICSLLWGLRKQNMKQFSEGFGFQREMQLHAN